MPANNNAHLLCQHLTKAGHHCHMPLSAGHQSLCTHHLHIAKREAVRHAETAASQRDDSADLSALFSQDHPKQKSAADIHTHLWNLSLALQQGRISPRRAAVLAYISSLLLRTLPAVEKKENSAPQKIIIDIPGAIRHFPEDDEITVDSLRSGESLDSHPGFSATPAVVAAPFREPSESSIPRTSKSSDSHPASTPPPAPKRYGFQPTVGARHAVPASAPALASPPISSRDRAPL